MILQPLDRQLVGRNARAQHDMCLHDLAAGFIGRADHRTFADIRMRQQRRFDFGTGNIVSGTR